jgi:soluble lytic murein transglycosylase
MPIFLMGHVKTLTISRLRIWGVLAALLVALAASSAMGGQLADEAGEGDVPVLTPTVHPELPADLSQLWLAPRPTVNSEARLAPEESLARAIKLEGDSRFSEALNLLRAASLQKTALADYASYYLGQAQLGLKQFDRARDTFATLVARGPSGYLSEAAPLAEAQAAEQANDFNAAVAIYQTLLQHKPTMPADILLRLGRAAAKAGDQATAASAWRRVYYEFPLSDQADPARQALAAPGLPALSDADRYAMERSRAGLLFQAGHYKEARDAYAALVSSGPDADRAMLSVRLAACDLNLGRHRQARDEAQPYTTNGPLQAEATYDYVSALRGLGESGTYVQAVHQMSDRFGSNPWVESALNDLASEDIINDQDDAATAVFQDMVTRFPDGPHAERAAWKVGWAAYRAGDFGTTVKTFDAAAARYPRSNYRPAYLYWSGRAYESLKDRPIADARFALVAVDYLNSYYGRRAVEHLGGEDAWRKVAANTMATTPAADPTSDPAADLPRALPPTGEAVRLLLSVGLYDQAMNELRYAQRAWGNSPVVEATIGWIDNRQGNLRSGINAMKIAYPQYLAASGDSLPAAILKVLFPLDYWPLIKKYSTAHHLDPYLMAALIAQESTFEPAIRSSANAIGLMQILPSTGRQYARELHYRRFSTRMLTDAAVNIRLGMAYFSDLVERLGGVHYALASYNAGASRVVQWIAERKGLGFDQDAFIEDIPYPETQNYVKKILGTAADYRRLYGDETSGEIARDERAPAEAKTPSGVKKKRTPVRHKKKVVPKHRRSTPAKARHAANRAERTTKRERS